MVCDQAATPACAVLFLECRSPNPLPSTTRDSRRKNSGSSFRVASGTPFLCVCLCGRPLDSCGHFRAAFESKESWVYSSECTTNLFFGATLLRTKKS